jgi:hypothetical protein
MCARVRVRDDVCCACVHQHVTLRVMHELPRLAQSDAAMLFVRHALAQVGGGGICVTSVFIRCVRSHLLSCACCA